MGERVAKLISLDFVRLLKLLEIFQYSTIFFLITFAVSYLIRKSKNQEQTAAHTKKLTLFEKIKLIAIINLEIFGICVLFFYIRKLGLIIPSIPSMMSKNFKPYTTLDYTTHIALVVVFVELMPHFIERIQIINNNF